MCNSISSEHGVLYDRNPKAMEIYQWSHCLQGIFIPNHERHSHQSILCFYPIREDFTLFHFANASTLFHWQECSEESWLQAYINVSNFTQNC